VSRPDLSRLSVDAAEAAQLGVSAALRDLRARLRDLEARLDAEGRHERASGVAAAIAALVDVQWEIHDELAAARRAAR
jgi:hypothetical protein